MRAIAIFPPTVVGSSITERCRLLPAPSQNIRNDRHPPIHAVVRNCNPIRLATDLGIMVTAAPVSTLASIVSTCPVDGFSRLMYTYTCSYGAFNFNRSIFAVFCSTFNHLWLWQFVWLLTHKVHVSEIWDLSFFLVCHILLVLVPIATKVIIYFELTKKWREKCRTVDKKWREECRSVSFMADFIRSTTVS